MTTNAKYSRACDEQLVSFYIAGEEEALEMLISRYHQKIFSYLTMFME